ncbi:MAG: tetratricopeptide repeat protein [Blastocatellia bacterium]|nr:tetratricopeptide repeat protein [Blastocatellia bacterium]
MRSTLALIAVLFLFAMPASAQDRELKPGESVEFAATGQEPRRYQLQLTPLDYARLTIHPRNQELTIRVTAPGGAEIVSRTIPRDSGGSSPVSFIGGYWGAFRVEIVSREKEASEEKVELKFVEKRAATPQDAARIAAEEAFAAGEGFRVREVNEERRPGIPKYEEALRLWRQVEDRAGQSLALHGLGRLYDNLNEGNRAFDHFTQALAIRRELQDRAGEAASLAGIAAIHNNRGERQKALEIYQQVLAIRQELKERRGEAGTMHSLGLVYRGLNQRSKALEFFEKSLAIRQEVKDRRGVASAFAEIGAISRQMGRFDRAFESYNQALPIFQSLEDKRGEAVTLNSIGVLFLSQGKRKDSIPYFERALDIQHALGAKRQEATTLSNMGAAFDEMGERPRALEHYNRALAISREINDQPGVARTLHGIGEVHTSMGENRRAMEYFQQAQPLLRATGGPGGEANALFSLGKVNSEMGERQLALDYYQQALERWREANFAAGQASALASIGLLYNSLGERNLALGYLNQGLELWRKMKNPLEEANLLTFLGVVSHNLDEREKALDYLDQALRLAKEDRGVTAMALNSSAIIHRDMEEYPKALDELGRALPLARAIGDRGLEADTLHNTGWVQRAMKELPAARENLTRSLDLYRGIGNRASEAATTFALAHIENDAGNLQEARALVESAIEIAESLRAGLGSEQLRTSYFASVQKYYDLYIDVLMKLHDRDQQKGFNAEALQVTERARARGLLDLLNESGADIRQGVDVALLDRERELQLLISAKAARQTQLRLAKAPAPQIEQINSELEKLTAEAQTVQARIRATSPRYAALTQPRPLTAREIQEQVLDKDTILLEYALGDERSFLWAVTPTSIRSYTLPKREEINKAARGVYELLTERNQLEEDGGAPASAAQQQRRIAEADARLGPELARLGRMLLGPVAAQLGNKRLLIVTQGALQYLPFGALPEPQPRRGEGATRRPVAASPSSPLIARHEIVSLPSASTLAVLRRDLANRRPAAKTLAVFADPVFEKDDERVTKVTIKADPAKAPNTAQTRLLKHASSQFAGRIPRLPFTREEANSLLALVPETEARAAVGFDASRQTVKTADLSQYRYVHFATHGLLNSENPELSSIVLSLVDEAGKPQDGFLRAMEIYNLNLPAETVVLSACETGLGKQIKGEGLVGLTRGFMYAGTPRVVVSLWSVNDRATADLMTRLYRKMITEKLPTAAALRAAQLEMLRDTQWKSPYFWAAFALQGEWR